MVKMTKTMFTKIQDHHRLMFLLTCNLMVWMLVVGTICWTVNDVFATERLISETDSRHSLHVASHAVDHAWEEFHRSAIGGTLASPTIQTQIEQQLHEARSLLMQARRAEREDQYSSVKRITDRVMNLSALIVTSSRERKP